MDTPIKYDLGSTDSNTSDLSEVSQDVVSQMACLEQEETLASIPEGLETTPQNPPSDKCRISNVEWSSMTRTQRRNYKRKKGEKDAPSKGDKRASGSGKRPREEGTTPSPIKGDRKKPKTEAPKYSHMVSCMKVAVTPADHPHVELTKELSSKLEERLVELLRAHDPAAGTLNFCGYVFRSGALVINCENERSKDWIVKTVDDIKELDGVRLRTCDPKELEGFVRISAFIPGPVRKTDMVLQNIKSQNGIATEKWKILPGGVKEQPKGLFLVASIPESHFSALEKNGFRVSCGLQQVEIRKLKEKRAEEARKPTGKKPEAPAKVGKGVEDEAKAGMEGVEAGEPAPIVDAAPGCSGSGSRYVVPKCEQSGAKGKPTSGGGQREAVSKPVIGGAAEGDLVKQGSIGGNPPS